MRRVALAVAMLAIVLSTSHARAASPTGKAPSKSAAERAQQAIELYYEHLYALKFELALADVSTLHPAPSNLNGRAIVNSMRAVALLGLKRDAEAQSLISEMRQIKPMDPTASSNLFEGALFSDHFDVAADALDDLIARFPDAVRGEDDKAINYFLGSEPKGEDHRNQDRRIALARLGYGGDTGTGHFIAFSAVRILVGRGDISAASDLLPYVNDPGSFESMLIQKRYAPLWPELVTLGGAHLDKVRASALAAVEKAYLAAPDRADLLQDYIDALRHAGRLDEAIALKAKLPPPTAMASVDEKMGWVANSIAYALYAAGRKDEGDRLFAMLNEPPRKDASWRVGTIINRVELLASSGRFEDASRLLDAAELSAKTDGNSYARQLIRRLRYCTWSRLGRSEEAAKLLPEVLSNAKDAYGPTIDGLLCAGQVDTAEKVALEALAGAERDDFAGTFVRSLQPVALTPDDTSYWQGRWKELRQRPRIAEAYDQLGRDLPSELLSRPSGKVR